MGRRITMHNIYRRFRANIDFGITIHFTLLTTTKHVANGTDSIIDFTRYSLLIICNVFLSSTCSRCGAAGISIVTGHTGRTNRKASYFNRTSFDLGNVVISTTC